MDILQELLEDPEVTEIMVNGPEQIFVERKSFPEHGISAARRRSLKSTSTI